MAKAATAAKIIPTITRLELVRRSRKINRTDLANDSDVGMSTIYDIEKGNKKPLVETMLKIRNSINRISTKKGLPPVTLDDICDDMTV